MGILRPFDRLFFLMSSDAPDIAVELRRSSGSRRAHGLSLQHERLDLMAAYLKYRFASAAANLFIEEGRGAERNALAWAPASQLSSSTTRTPARSSCSSRR